MTDAAMLQRLADAISGVAKEKDLPSGTPSTAYYSGPNGLWSYPGSERPIISTRLIPRGLAGAIPARPNNSMYPLYPYFTGFSTVSETQPDGVCDNPPTAGLGTNCYQTATFGRYSYETRVLDITSLGQRINRGEFTDLFFENDPLAGGPSNANGLIVPESTPLQMTIYNEARMRFMEIGISFQNKLGHQFYEGNPTNNTAHGGYKEFPGLDILVSTGKKDAVTGTACPSLDSMILDANYKKVDNVTGNDNVINVLTYTFRILNDKAERSGLGPATFVMAMRETLFYELTGMWPCSYLTYRCVFGANQSGGQQNVNIDAGDAIAMRDAMRQGSYLVIDGKKVAVVIDDAIHEETSGDTSKITNGSFASNIYILPLTFQGGKSALFWEYFDWNGDNAAMAAVNALPLANNFFWSDGGKFLWHFKPPNNWCVQWLGLMEPRLILRTPHLAAKLKHIQYSPLMHPGDAYPNDPYFVQGGVGSRTTSPSWYNSWAPVAA